MWIYLLYTIKEVLYNNSYVQNILHTDESTIICMIFGLNENTIQYNTHLTSIFLHQKLVKCAFIQIFHS
jgi:hypothetical protein